MSLLRHALREYAMHRLATSQRRRYGYGRSSRRRPHPFILRPPRRRTRVHVTGCCLPIPLGMLIASSLAGRALIRRRA